MLIDAFRTPDERFEQLVDCHHEAFEYSQGIRAWRAGATNPDHLGGDMPAGMIVARSLPREGHDPAAIQRAYEAPFDGAVSKAGARRFTFCIPFAERLAGNAADQERCFHMLPTLNIPTHLIFGDADPVFTWEWAERWHSHLPGSTLDRIVGGGHFVQEDATVVV
jgi:haloalkane dehalogenase